MGADLYIKSKADPDAEVVRKMHKNGEFENFVPKKLKDGVYLYYFRDSYNDYNLAWIAGKCYLLDFKEDPEAFLRALANVTDERIEWYYKIIYSRAEEPPEGIFDETDEERMRVFEVIESLIRGLAEEPVTDEEFQEIIDYVKGKRDYLKHVMTGFQSVIRAWF
ncbi:hypothetical protein J7M00_08125 [bacterium]|nr:hypothetical protein [bacterium]